MSGRDSVERGCDRFSRRGFLERAGVTGAAVLGGTHWSAAPAVARARCARARRLPIEHVVVSCKENRSFDHYFGYAPWIGRYGPPPGWSQPDGRGGTVQPHRSRALSTPDIPHSWAAAHREWNGGAMDGFHATGGVDAMGYYTAKELGYYYGLFREFTLCASYFCSVLGPTYPNRLYLAAGTSGGVTTNGLYGYGIFDYPIILDLLEERGIT